MTVEFLLLAPVLVGIILVLLQTVLLLQARVVVNQAAISAARSAMVVVPETLYDRSTNRTEEAAEIAGDDPASPKIRLIRRAAALVLATLTPKCGLIGAAWNDSSAANANTALAAAGASFLAGGASADMAQELAIRYACANDPDVTLVSVEVQRAEQKQAGAHADPAIVHLTLKYRYELVVPVANRILGSSESKGFLRGRGFFREIEADFSMPVDLSPLMPEKLKPGMYFEPEILE